MRSALTPRLGSRYSLHERPKPARRSPVPAIACWKTRRFLHCLSNHQERSLTQTNRPSTASSKKPELALLTTCRSRGNLRRTSKTSTPRTLSSAMRSPTNARSWSSVQVSQVCCCGTDFAKPVSKTSASARRAAMSAGRGTGIGTPA